MLKVILILSAIALSMCCEFPATFYMKGYNANMQTVAYRGMYSQFAKYRAVSNNNACNFRKYKAVRWCDNNPEESCICVIETARWCLPLIIYEPNDSANSVMIETFIPLNYQNYSDSQILVRGRVLGLCEQYY